MVKPIDINGITVYMCDVKQQKQQIIVSTNSPRDHNDSLLETGERDREERGEKEEEKGEQGRQL